MEYVRTAPVRQLAQRYTVLTYASLHPETLPPRASQAIGNPNLRNFSVGAGYARTSSDPSGAYGIVLTLN